MLGISMGLWGNVAAVSGGGGGGAFTPASISGLDFWIEADPTKLYTDNGTTLVSADGQAVFLCKDKSASARNVAQPTLAERPLYKTDLTKPSLLFAASEWLTTLALGGQSWTDGSGQFWFAASIQPGGAGGDQEVMTIYDDSGATGYVSDMFISSTGVAVEIHDTAGSGGGTETVSKTGISVGTPVVIMGQVLATQAQAFVDNVGGTVGNLTGTPRSNTANMLIGSQHGSNQFTGRLFGACHGTGVLGSTDRANLQTYLAGLHP